MALPLTPQKAKAMTVAKLKDELAERGLSTDGKKVSVGLRVCSLVCRTRLGQECPPSIIHPRAVLALKSPLPRPWQ